MHPLPRRRTRLFVLLFVVAALALAVLASVLILRAWNDDALQRQLQQINAGAE